MFDENSFPLNFQDMYININGDDVSDVIFRYTNIFKKICYHNTRTGARSMYFCNVVSDRRFIVMNYDSIKRNKDKDIVGIYVKYNEKFDALIIVFCEYVKEGKWHWKETDRSFISRDSVGESLDYYSARYDICGQSNMINFGTNNSTLSLTQSHTLLNNKEGEMLRYDACYAVGLRMEALKYFHGFVCRDDEFITFRYESEFLRVFSYYQNSDVRKTLKEGIVYYGCDEKELGDIPQTYINRMESIGWELFKKEVRKTKNNRYHCYDEGDELRLCVLQNVDGDVWQRSFAITYEYGYPFINGTNIRFIEYERINLNKINDIPKGVTRIPIVGYDDLSGTAFEHITSILDGYDKYDINLFYAVEIAAEVACSPVFEKFLNLRPNNDSYKRCILNRFLGSSKHADEWLDEVFGGIDTDKKRLHEIIGVPKGMLESIIDNTRSYDFEFVGIVKNIFSCDEARQYMLRMNRQDIDEMICFMKDYCSYYSNMSDVLNIMVALYGVKNWKGYFSQVNKSIKNNYFSLYADYIRRLGVLGDAAKGSEWKLDEDSLKTAYDAIGPAYSVMLDKTKYKEYVELFEKRAAVLNEYQFEKGGYQIVIPKKPSDIIIEGMALKHCVKSFIEPHGLGRTTVLFIRKKDDPQKPYFTLEIRHNKVRQCHGFDNRNMDRDLCSFLLDFCEEKKVKFTQGTERLAYDD